MATKETREVYGPCPRCETWGDLARDCLRCFQPKPQLIQSVSFTVLGALVSLKNSRRILRQPRTGKPFSAKSEAAARYREDFLLQVPPEAKRGLGSQTEPLRATITVWYPSWRNDLDVGLVLDLLQESGVIANDRWVREQHVWAEVDAANPRADITVEAI